MGMRRMEVLPISVVEKTVGTPKAACPRCKIVCSRLQMVLRQLWELGKVIERQEVRSYEPRRLLVRYAHYHCRSCDHYFSADTSYIGPPKCHYTLRVAQLR